uniref:Uncharacterized protein n=1 Tax=Opuntia streptacantha TaxID=393608 RepID=A0A7C9F2I2_OPUST
MLSTNIFLEKTLSLLNQSRLSQTGYRSEGALQGTLSHKGHTYRSEGVFWVDHSLTTCLLTPALLSLLAANGVLVFCDLLLLLYSSYIFPVVKQLQCCVTMYENIFTCPVQNCLVLVAFAVM